MKGTIDETIKRWLQKWLGVDAVATLQLQEVERLDAVGRIVQNKLTDALNEIENTRLDLIQRMEDLSIELAKRKEPAKDAKGDGEQIVPARMTFSQRRREAQGRASNPAAYVVPGKKV